MKLADELKRWGPEADFPVPSRDAAQTYCRRLAQSHYENFSVVSWLFPRHLRQHLCNVYAYCRWADDLADETEHAAESLRLLDWWEAELAAAQPRNPVFIALRETIREKQIPLQPFRDLLIAFRQDQRQTRYDTWDELREYCRHSADPVGRIVLHLGNSATAENEALSDSICTGLQLINFCQDVQRDFEKGRIYLPREDRNAFGWGDTPEHAGAASAQFDDFQQSHRDMLKQQVNRAEGLLRAGEPLVTQVHRDLRLPVRVFIDGGLAIAAAIRRQRYDVWERRPTVSRWQKIRLLWRAWWS